MSVERLLQLAVPQGPASRAGTQARLALKLNKLNFAYFLSLYAKYLHGSSSRPEQLGCALVDASDPRVKSYRSLEKQFDGRFARTAGLVLKKLNAGLGSSLERKRYLATRGINTDLGAKGTDLFTRVRHPLDPEASAEVPLAEVQLLQNLKGAAKGGFASITVQDMVGPTTLESIRDLWQRPCLQDPRFSYEQVFERTRGVKMAAPILQQYVPTLSPSGEISFERLAPAGHGFFVFEILLSLIESPELGPEPEIAAIANGEDLNASPDPVVVDWMVKTQTPLAILTTNRTPTDVKGGLLTRVRDGQGEEYLTILDTAQAKAMGQGRLFDDGRGLLNTNLVLFNLKPLRALLKDVPRDELIRAMTPDLILNVKEQVNCEGERCKFTQFEGTLGTAVANLDRYLRRTTGHSPLAIVNVETERRTDFFSPVKSAFDFFMQFHSDRFTIDPETYRLRQSGFGIPPAIALKDQASGDQFYQDVQNVLEAFAGASTRRLTDLNLSGKVTLRDAILQGRVHIVNHTGLSLDGTEFAHQWQDGRPILSDIEVIVDALGAVDLRHVEPRHSRTDDSRANSTHAR